MKNTIFILVVGLFVFQGFGAETENLQLQFKPKQVYRVQLTEKNKISQSVAGQLQTMEHKRLTGLKFMANEVQDNGDTTLKVTYLAIKEKTTSPMGVMEYDSTQPDAATNHPLAPTYEALVGSSFTFKMNRSGKIVKLNGIDKMLSQMAKKMVMREDASKSNKQKVAMDKMHGSRGKRINAMKQSLGKMPFVGEEPIKEMLKSVVIMLPSRTMKIGDSWVDRMNVWQYINVDTTYGLKESKKDIAILEVNWSRGKDQAPIVVEQGSEKVEMKVVGSGKGKMRLPFENLK